MPSIEFRMFAPSLLQMQTSVGCGTIGDSLD
jgi:hypothetical protein